jgi:spermidine synthase
MKLVEAPGGIQIILSNLENKVYDSMTEEKCKEDLSERDAYVAQSLVSKGVCKKTQREGKTYFSKAKGSL